MYLKILQQRNVFLEASRSSERSGSYEIQQEVKEPVKEPNDHSIFRQSLVAKEGPERCQHVFKSRTMFWSREKVAG